MNECIIHKVESVSCDGYCIVRHITYMYMYLICSKSLTYLSNQLAICSKLQRSPLLAISRGKSGGKEHFLHPRIHALLQPSAHRTRAVSNHSPEPPLAVTVVLSQAAADS